MALGLILMIVPFMIVVVLLVMVATRGCGPMILGSQHGWRHGDWDGKRGTQQGRIQETKHKFVTPSPWIAQLWYQALNRELWQTQTSQYRDDATGRSLGFP